MQSRLLLLFLLVAGATARQMSQAQPTPHLVRKSMKLEARQPLAIFPGGDSTGSGSVGDTSDTTSSTTTSSSSSSSPSSTSTSSTSTSSSTSSASRTTTSYQSTVTASPTARVSSTTNSSGSVVLVTSTVDPTATSTTVPLASASQTAGSESSSGGHTGLIIGVSVVGGIALIGALIFLWMKFGGKRFSDYHDEDADIKWPELKADGDAAALQPLPARRTGGAGFDMGNEFDDGHEGDGHSMAEYGNKGRDSMTGSTTALNAGVGAGSAYGAGAYGAGMDANYHDEAPSATGHYSQPGVAGYYDPYSGYPSGGQSQNFYPEQTHDVAGGNYNDYHNQSDPYAAARAQASSVSPPMQPYRVGGQSMHQGF